MELKATSALIFFFVAGHGNVPGMEGSTDFHSIESGSSSCISSSSPSSTPNSGLSSVEVTVVMSDGNVNGSGDSGRDNPWSL
jgi:hypothetical protein